MARYEQTLVDLAIKDICEGCQYFIKAPPPNNCKILKQNYRDFIETKCKFYEK